MFELTEAKVKALLQRGQPRYRRRLDSSVIAHLASSFGDWPGALAPASDFERGLGERNAYRVADYLLYALGESQKKMSAMQRRYAQYCRYYGRAVSTEEKQQHILDFARDLGATRRQRRQDRRAFDRWFGHDAISDRYQHRLLEEQRKQCVMLQCMGQLFALVLSKDGENTGFLTLWSRLGVEAAIQPFLVHQGDNRIVRYAFECLATALRAIPQQLQQRSVSDRTLNFVYRSALQSRQHVWVQCEALAVLETLSPEALAKALEKRLRTAHGDDDIFVRRQAVEIIGRNLSRYPSLLELFPHIIEDPSPFVRQAVCSALVQAPAQVVRRFLAGLVCDDTAKQVRAASLLSIPALLNRGDCADTVRHLLLRVLREENDEFVLRVAFKVILDGMRLFRDAGSGESAREWQATFLPGIETLHQTAASLKVRRWAAQTRESIWCLGNRQASALRDELERFLRGLRSGKSRRMPKRLAASDEEMLGRVLSIIAQEDFGFDVEQTIFGRFITRGHVFGFRLWRVLHEFRRPSPDKRQAFPHTTGRHFYGRLRVPSGILSELTETKVPGEPFFISSEAGWRGYLPLVDEVISSLQQSGRNRPVRLFTSEGITELTPPRSILKRCRARVVLNMRFAEYASLRNRWDDDPRSYLQALARLGFEIRFRGHGSIESTRSEDPSVTRFFPVWLPFAGDQGWSRFQDYFFSVYENSIAQLAAFVIVAFLLFLGRHLYLYRRLGKARNRLPLVIGGWGTRGKSGTERLKAAVFDALGYNIVCKTTGCEAMFLQAYPLGSLREMFLFRPYDKATIWEQHNLVRLAEQLKCEVFLWECMGLTPSYVELLQRQWMRDDLSTITNTYPDHEDLQGPAGIDIPEVMTRFIPRSSVMITSEEQMRPILEDAAEALDTRVEVVGWLEAGLLAPDLLARFPYEEHPYNIALVLAMADELGIPRDFALKEMADRVVPDLGVLKTYPSACVRTRRLEFINGMSANERYGCLENWRRMALDTIDPESDSDIWITALVNNRADRIARSRVFASILVKDISFDRCVLIGSNLSGFRGYIAEAWGEWSASISLSGEQEIGPHQILLQMAKRFRVPTSDQIVQTRLRTMLKGQMADSDSLANLWREPERLRQALTDADALCIDETLSFLQQDISLYNSYRSFCQRIHEAGEAVSEELNRKFRGLLRQWFDAKIVVIEDYHAPGNKVIDEICTATPPGFYNRIVGLQNIKGTGLDFVYRWQAWEGCQRACEQLASTDEATMERGLETLTTFQEYGLLSEEKVRELVDAVRTSTMAQTERHQAQLNLIISNLDQAMQQVRANMFTVNRQGWGVKLFEAVEGFFDPGDAVKRRRRANRIYKDLAAERISHERAALELQKLNKRQKGGWLLAALLRTVRRTPKAR
jgi:gamma-polyglutamate synthase